MSNFKKYLSKIQHDSYDEGFISGVKKIGSTIKNIFNKNGKNIEQSSVVITPQEIEKITVNLKTKYIQLKNLLITNLPFFGIRVSNQGNEVTQLAFYQEKLKDKLDEKTIELIHEIMTNDFSRFLYLLEVPGNDKKYGFILSNIKGKSELSLRKDSLQSAAKVIDNLREIAQNRLKKQNKTESV